MKAPISRSSALVTLNRFGSDMIEKVSTRPRLRFKTGRERSAPVTSAPLSQRAPQQCLWWTEDLSCWTLPSLSSPGTEVSLRCSGQGFIKAILLQSL